MLLLELPHVREIIARVSLKEFYLRLFDRLAADFADWHNFDKSSRHAAYVPNGVLELMPVCGKEFYSFKYVNGHPNNPQQNRLNIVAFGMLASVETGYPLMISAMTLLTAVRTAAIAALSSKYLAKKNSKKLAIIGCGAQSEFQVLAHHALFDLEEVHYFDLHADAMKRFEKNLQGQSFKLMPAEDARSAIKGVDIIITATAARHKQKVIEYSWLEPGQHICGVGGDSPGKTELDPEILKHAKIVVEYFPQTAHEGEIQNLGENAKEYVHAELWQVIRGEKSGREADEISLFDDVGFALEDYSVLRLAYELAKEYHIGKEIELTPEYLEDCRDLYGLLMK